jgi:two-component system, OmpR family, response regulator RegX3
MRELIARIRAILRRIETSQHEALLQSSISVGAIEMDIPRRRVIVRGKPVHLPLKQFELLRTLMINAGQTVSREDLVKCVWDSDTATDGGSLDVHIRWLREKIEEDPGYPHYLRTVRGIGYSMVLTPESNN